MRLAKVNPDDDLLIYERIAEDQFFTDRVESTDFVIEHGLLEMCGYECQD